ncbi:MAG: dephospho-CoA kinase [Vallitalea sp.]|jgi:dephospho-CoA kinase|nr:dephospho-CoA kinase [Vallitalea sp.]
MKIIGVIGGCGSGKSQVSQLLIDKFDAYVINADEVSHEIIRKGTKAYHEIVYFFGKKILDSEGNINRKTLGKIVFSDKILLDKLTNITHPYINEEIIQLISTLKQNNQYKYIVVEITALGRGEIYNLIDEFWYIYCDIDVRLERLNKYRNMSKEKAMSIINKQWSNSEFEKFADIIINNSFTLDNTYQQISKHLD